MGFWLRFMLFAVRFMAWNLEYGHMSAKGPKPPLFSWALKNQESKVPTDFWPFSWDMAIFYISKIWHFILELVRKSGVQYTAQIVFKLKCGLGTLSIILSYQDYGMNLFLIWLWSSQLFVVSNQKMAIFLQKNK